MKKWLLPGLLGIVLFLLVSISTASGFLLYQVLRPPQNPTTDTDHSTKFSFRLPNGTTREGWFFTAGLHDEPTIVVSCGYLWRCADVLTLVAALQGREYNVFLVDLAGQRTSPGVTTLGYKETAELHAAVQALATRDDVDVQHFGLWGVDMGGYAALEVAATDRRIEAVAVDDTYDDPRDFLWAEGDRSKLYALPGVLRFADFEFRLLNYSFRHEPPISKRLAQTAGIPKLFIASDDRPVLAAYTLRLFDAAPEPKQILRNGLSYHHMSDEDRETYDSQVVDFFVQNMPPN